MKKILILIYFVFLAVIVQAQGLDSIIVEKYYVSNAADAAYAAANEANPLPVGSVTYRFYVDMAPGWNLQMAYGNGSHTLDFTTTTTFFNNDDFGSATPSYNATNAKKGTTMLDSWLTLGSAASGHWGILKSEDVTPPATFINANGILANTDAAAGIPLTVQDGLRADVAATTASFLGTSSPFTGTGVSSYVNNSGSWYLLGGVVGPTPLNRVLIAQITTDGALSYNLNVLLGDGLGGTVAYVATAPTGLEVSGPQYKLSGTFSSPSVAVTAPASGATFPFGSPYALAALATAPIGTIDSVEFYVDGVKVGSDLTGVAGVFGYSWTPSVAATVSITAKAYDNLGNSSTSPAVSANVFDPNAAFAIDSTFNLCTNDIFRMPVNAITATSVQNAIGVDFSMKYDGTKVRPTGIVYVSTDLVATAEWFTTSVNIIELNPADVDSVNISMYLNGTAPAGTTLSGQGTLISIEFAKTVNFNSVDTAQFDIDNMVISTLTTTVPKIVTSGVYRTYRDDNFLGSLKYWKDNSPIAYDATHLITNIYGMGADGKDTATAVTPDLGGSFVYNSLISNKIKIKRDIANTTPVVSVINGADAQIVARILVNDVNLRPSVYQLIAADVNRDGVISAGDLSQINQRVVLNQGAFVQATTNSPALDWVFIDSKSLLEDYTYRISQDYPVSDGIGYSRFMVPIVDTSYQLNITGSNCPIIVPESYTGVMLGDVNGSYANIAASTTLKSAKAESNTVVFDFENAIMSDYYVDVPVYINSNEGVTSLDLTLQVNEENLIYSAVIQHAGYLRQTDHYNSGDNTLRISTYSLKNYVANRNLLSVRFLMNSNLLNSADLSKAEAYVNGTPAVVKITDSKSVVNPNATLRVWPNPSNGIFNLVSPEDAKLQLMDLSGRSILFETNVNANWKHEINVSNLASGIYMLKIYNDEFVAVKKIVIEK